MVSGVLNDGANDYPAGTFAALHRLGSRPGMRPQSAQGCVLFELLSLRVVVAIWRVEEAPDGGVPGRKVAGHC